MEKVQHFEVDGMLYSMQCAYHPEEIVWTADIEPYEWNTESAMRRDMLIHFLAEDEQERSLFEAWDCRDEDTFLQEYNKYQSWVHNDDHEYDPNKNI